MKDEKQFENIYRRFFLRVFTFFRRRGYSEEDGRDLAQDVFMRAFTNWDQHRSDEALPGWIKSITLSIWKNNVRHEMAGKRKAEEVTFNELASPYKTNDEEPLLKMIDEENRLRVYRELKKLPARMKQCVVFRLKGRSYEEISILLKVSRDTVKSQLGQARRRLSEKLRQ
ncbi:MAG: RNA polymerase sigma factor [Acidobacteriota bacterium]|nr:RNA polymerase sigma factor [Acidobacteriota bacterium]